MFALSGLVLGDLDVGPAIGSGGLLQVVAIAVVWDVLLTPFVLPPLMKLFARLDPQWASA